MVPLQHVVPGAIVRLIAAQPHSAGKVEAAWRLAVGAGLARLSRARRDAGGVLWVEVSDDHVVRALDSHRPLIEQRLRAMLGDHVRVFRVMETARD
jgi:hypothetical protein